MGDTAIDQIWAEDLFGRRQEADQIEAYIESISGQEMERDNGRAYTIAIDAPYGVGKTFFLKRLARQLEQNHPTAFVDAWADDLLDEPLTALAATLKHALEPYLQNADVESKWQKFLGTAGRLAKIAAVGAVKRGVGMVVGAMAADLIHQELAATDTIKESLEDSMKDLGKEAPKETMEALNLARGGVLMAERIDKFEAGKAAVEALKQSLRDVVESLDQVSAFAPVVIIIDELDRCRPTYAVKLLEEIKHLFDVPGLVFFLGTNEVQLAKSLAGAYGPEFDGAAYLRRFISRYYRLADPDLTPLLAALVDDAGIDGGRLISPEILVENRREAAALPYLLAQYMRAYNLTAREAPAAVTALRTFMALSHSKYFLTPLLFPLIMQKISGHFSPTFDLPVKRKDIDEVKLMYCSRPFLNDNTSVDHLSLVRALKNLYKLSVQKISESGGDQSLAMQLLIRVYRLVEYHDSKILRLSEYRDVLESVGRFS